jgi:hypothetical protein
MRCRASRPGWRRGPLHYGANRVRCAPIGHDRSLLPFVWRPAQIVCCGCTRQSCASQTTITLDQLAGMTIDRLLRSTLNSALRRRAEVQSCVAAVAASRRNRRGYRRCNFPWPIRASVSLPSWSMPLPEPKRLQVAGAALAVGAAPSPGEDQAAKSFFEDLLRRGRLKVARAANPAAEVVRSSAAPTRETHTHELRREGRQMVLSPGSHRLGGGAGTVENTPLAPI